MKVRRTPHHVDLSTLPLDAVDAFLLSRVDEELTLEQLTEVAPCTPEEVAHRVAKLIRLALLEVDEPDVQNALAHHDLPLPELDELVLDEAAPTLDDTWLAEEDLPVPLPPPAAELPQLQSDVQSLLFADPPSTLHSLLERGPLLVEIHTLTKITERVTEDSNVFRRPDAPDDVAPEDVETRRKG